MGPKGLDSRGEGDQQALLRIQACNGHNFVGRNRRAFEGRLHFLGRPRRRVIAIGCDSNDSEIWGFRGLLYDNERGRRGGDS